MREPGTGGAGGGERAGEPHQADRSRTGGDIASREPGPARDGDEPPAAPPTHVLVLSTEGAPRRSRLRGRRPRPAAPEPEPEAVAIARATVIDARGLDREEDARRWLSGDASQRVAEAVAVLNRALRAHRAATADPYVREVRAAQALAVRIGFGEGEQVADGRWSEALTLPPPQPPPRRTRRAAALRPQERLAALLGARDHVLACEELALRARLDLDEDREPAAALQLRAALDAALAELGGSDDRELAPRLAELEQRRASVADAARDALQGPLDRERRAGLELVLERLEALLRARAAGRR